MNPATQQKISIRPVQNGYIVRINQELFIYHNIHDTLEKVALYYQEQENRALEPNVCTPASNYLKRK